MDDILARIATDFPIIAVLLVVLIGQHRLAGRILDLIEVHLDKNIEALERTADEIRYLAQSDRKGSRSSSDSHP
jgi:hypothetical protein